MSRISMENHNKQPRQKHARLSFIFVASFIMTYELKVLRLIAQTVVKENTFSREID